jgi:prepilin-type N-terminal cleavage/methylation domain-containing protein
MTPTRRGFSLVEALIALIIAALVLMAIFELQRQLSRDQARYEQAIAAADRRRNALVLLRDLNPTERPSGALPLSGGRVIRWTAAPPDPAARQRRLSDRGRRLRDAAVAPERPDRERPGGGHRRLRAGPTGLASPQRAGSGFAFDRSSPPLNGVRV